MLTRNDLDEAVRGGIITAAQAESLLALPAKRHEARQAQTLRDERFVFMKSFNEFFIALGVVLLGVGLWTAGSGETRFATWIAWSSPVIIWGLAEYLTARKRYTLPSIVLAILFIVLDPVAFPRISSVLQPTFTHELHTFGDASRLRLSYSMCAFDCRSRSCSSLQAPFRSFS